MYDVTHGHEKGHNDGAYSVNKLHHNEWKLNTHSVCFTHPAAQAVRRLEGTKYVTISLVLPAIYKLLGNLRKTTYGSNGMTPQYQLQALDTT